MAMFLSASGFVAGFFIVVGAFFLMIGVIELTRGLASRSWDTVCGEIIESRVTQGLAPRYGWLWHVEVRYRYIAEGLTYEGDRFRSEEHTSELQSHHDLVCRLLLEKKKAPNTNRLPSTSQHHRRR